VNAAAHRTRAGIAAALLALSLAGCASTQPIMAVPAPVLAGRPLVLMLPLANLSGRAEQGDAVSRVFQTALTATGAFEVVEYGEAEALALALRLRDTASPTTAQVQSLRDSTGARYVMAGTVLESGPMRVPEGDVPSVGVALRLIDTTTGRAVWADSRFRTGQDDETVFGWGRENDLNRLTSRLATEMFEPFRTGAARADSTKGRSK
jgi:TolB-like protein